jgi:hypothetical protein
MILKLLETFFKLCFILTFGTTKLQNNLISGIIVSVLALSVVDCGWYNNRISGIIVSVLIPLIRLFCSFVVPNVSMKHNLKKVSRSFNIIKHAPILWKLLNEIHCNCNPRNRISGIIVSVLALSVVDCGWYNNLISGIIVSVLALSVVDCGWYNNLISGKQLYH